ncbi:hypothetical protein LPB86_17515 [Pedobacter sp. MC2016-14]|uniref:hypothetical protein n=1 Tax=Pedobacter sp. MC2016-14 TaxID=2897327 RepID=UPI001E5332E3|nr:hypothetical protein [Pedobacter sp. MC2016-14]MCD0490043.1 hypothetical protein [Pedobacter sp. MC2016-14]
MTDNFQQAEFVAKVKILKVSQDTINTDYHNAEIQMVTLYKGKPRTDIKILSVLNSSCAFLPEVNSTWIVFASVWQGFLSFNFCSGSFQLDRAFDPIKYPNAKNNYRKSILLKEQVLAYLSHQNILNPNPAGLFLFNKDLATIKGYTDKELFAVFKVELNVDLSISKIEILKKFQNRALTEAVFNSIKNGLKIVKPSRNSITRPTNVIAFCYFYEGKDKDISFVSLNDV